MRVAIAVAVAGLMSSASARGQEGLSVAVVHMEQAMQATSHFQQAKKKMEREKAKRQTVLDDQQSKLEEQRKALEAKAMVATPETLQLEEQELFARTQELGRQFMALQQELTQLEQQYTAKLLERFQFVIRQIALEKDFDFVVDRGPDHDPNVLFIDNASDITDQVVKRYEKAFKDQPLKL